jgi:hypothetical protein
MTSQMQGNHKRQLSELTTDWVGIYRMDSQS